MNGERVSGSAGNSSEFGIILASSTRVCCSSWKHPHWRRSRQLNIHHIRIYSANEFLCNILHICPKRTKHSTSWIVAVFLKFPMLCLQNVKRLYGHSTIDEQFLIGNIFLWSCMVFRNFIYYWRSTSVSFGRLGSGIRTGGRGRAVSGSWSVTSPRLLRAPVIATLNRISIIFGHVMAVRPAAKPVGVGAVQRLTW